MQSTTIGLCREKGWLIVLTCSTCGHGGRSGAVIEWPDLAQFPEDMTEAELAANARFSSCGHKGAWIDHRQDPASKASASAQIERQALP
ncbi:hypothetical protein [Phenylobacterium sp.]|uniref:hypothetical protein n=1 Tax=Phenylobacterium sp. TaxID=1871053 RepID=UPI0025CDC58A|nr:hypothetical protein [Phenylobacterium sp.]